MYIYNRFFCTCPKCVGYPSIWINNNLATFRCRYGLSSSLKAAHTFKIQIQYIQNMNLVHLPGTYQRLFCDTQNRIPIHVVFCQIPMPIWVILIFKGCTYVQFTKTVHSKYKFSICIRYTK